MAEQHRPQWPRPSCNCSWRPESPAGEGESVSEAGGEYYYCREEVTIPQEPLKTAVAFVFLMLGLVATTSSLALTHERVPEADPLPDVILDNVRYQSWGLDVSEIIIILVTLVGFILVISHQHR